jgi:hypothetical protein
LDERFYDMSLNGIKEQTNALGRIHRDAALGGDGVQGLWPFNLVWALGKSENVGHFLLNHTASTLETEGTAFFRCCSIPCFKVI